MFRASRLKAMGPSNTVTNSPITRSQRVLLRGRTAETLLKEGE